ncbi:gluconokinase [Labedella endophytica]|uniref:Gluconokinase n=1 Tax=Labedella endophytica TaxID=1523160 RepID=A0A433JR64_9MICO|nr:gluconokinase [Labedella endophytica]RUQ99166.1 gluconokinase [Labedella endophytica]
MSSHAMPPLIALPPIVVMGVSGSGKSTMGALLGERLDIPFIDGDDLHPDANREKMRAGEPLDDDDRLPWLHRIGELIDAGLVEGHPTIVACSALRKSYRDLIRRHAPDAIFVHLRGSSELIADRMGARDHEYMPTTLLGSQLATLEPIEPDEHGIVVDVTSAPDTLADQIIAQLPAVENPAVEVPAVETPAVENVTSPDRPRS